MTPKNKTTSLSEIYERVTSHLKSPTLRQAYLDHTYLNRFQDDTAHVVIRSAVLAKLLQQRRTDLAAAFKSYFQRPIAIQFYRMTGRRG